jgi:hypothetical protein
MSFSLFDLRCPTCESQLQPQPGGFALCHRCQSLFLVRMGYLIPISSTDERFGALS